ncbi:hypothetical protein C8R47DRAFT_1239855, partial [Mycena vitilis]
MVSLSSRGLRSKLCTLERWCAVNFILANMVKTIISIFGPCKTPLPTFQLGSTTLSVKTDERYVGINLRTDTRNILASHYDAKARTERYCGHRIMAVEDMTGRLTPKELKQLYMARVDCHLTHGCEVSPDILGTSYLKLLASIQVNFLRRMLNLHSRSSIVALYTETGIMPIRVRRFLLALGHLKYLLGLQKDTYASAALSSSIELNGQGKKSWCQDLIKAAPRLPFDCPELLNLEWLQGELNSSVKLYLLHGRREPQKDKPAAHVTSCMRHYLSMVKTQEALTSLLLSTHLLAVEVLRYVDHAHQPVDQADRLCRFCITEVETPEHALLTCAASAAVVELRALFLGKLFSELPNL